MLFTNASFKGVLTNREGKTRMVIELDFVPMDDVTRANRVVRSVCGHKLVWGRTADGRVIAFSKFGRLAKKDFKRMREMGVVECASHLAFAPDKFKVGRKHVKLSETIDL